MTVVVVLGQVPGVRVPGIREPRIVLGIVLARDAVEARVVPVPEAVLYVGRFPGKETSLKEESSRNGQFVSAEARKNSIPCNTQNSEKTLVRTRVRTFRLNLTMLPFLFALPVFLQNYT